MNPENPRFKTKKRVLFCITKGNFGGAQRYVFDLATNLPKDQFEVAVAFGEGEKLEKKLKESGIRTIHLKSSQRNISFIKDISLFFELLSLFQKETPHIIHLNSSKMGFIGAIAARLYSKSKIIFTAHGWAFNDQKFWILKWFLKIMQWKTVLMTDQTIVVSEKTKKDVASWPFVGKKIKVVPNGIGPIDFFDKEEARQKLLPGKNGFWIGTVSELHKNKGVDLLIDATAPLLKENSTLNLVIIGEGEERNRLLALAAKTGFKDRIFFLGFIENASQFLKAFDIFVLASRTEGAPFVLLEAGMAEVPVIASNVGGIPEIIGHSEGVLFKKESLKEIKRNVENLLKDPEKSQEFAKNLKKKIESEFSLKRMVEATILIYNS